MIYREYPLPEPLLGAFLCAWEFQLEPGDPPVVQHSIPPDGTANLSLARTPDATLFRRVVGASVVSETVPVFGGWHYCGLRLRPEAQAAVLPVTPEAGSMQLCDGSGALALLWDDLVALSVGGTDWSGALATLGGITGEDRAIARAVDQLIASGGRHAVAALAQDAGLSERQFRRRFRTATGLGAKQYADVQRTRRALILSLEDADWAGIAAEAGFADQPHLARDIRERFGSPAARVGGYFGGMRHELLAPGPAASGVRNLQDTPAEAA